MQTLIKWPGGKSSEFETISRFLPSYTGNYIEPFFGGGAVFFHLRPTRAIINDISGNLMAFYRFVQGADGEFQRHLRAVGYGWEQFKQIVHPQAERLCGEFAFLREHVGYEAHLRTKIAQICAQAADEMQKNAEVIDCGVLEREVCRMVCDKVFRTRKNEQKYGRALSDEDLLKNIVTGFLSGYYMYMRALWNKMEKGSLSAPLPQKIAVFYYVREFCYGSMFRYNSAGDFNIPYGGIAYNEKDFQKKIETLFTEETRALFQNTKICNEDFEKILDMATEEDFLFLDPPYDTEFSEYENRSFSREDHRRLADRLRGTKAKFLLIVQNTPLIGELYQNSGYRIHAFDNRYLYCVRGRNARDAVHLIITNYDRDKTV